MPFKYFDVHAHLFPVGPGFEIGYSSEELAVVRQELGVKQIGVLICALDKYTNTILSAQLEQAYLFGATGFHPTEAHQYDETLLVQNLAHPKIIAVGEIGFDDYALKKQGASEMEIKIAIDKQVEIFERQVKLAKQHQKSLCIHVRGSRKIFTLAASELTRLAPLPPTNLHFFSGSHKLVRPLLDLGCYFSFGGALLRSYGASDGQVSLVSTDTQRLLKLMPVDRILTETDSPFGALRTSPEERLRLYGASPFGHSARDGRKNNPYLIAEIVNEMEKQLGRELGQQIISNSLRYLGLN